MVREEEKSKVGYGFVSRACRNLGFKSTRPYYNGLKNQEEGNPLSADQKAVMEEYNRLIKD